MLDCDWSSDVCSSDLFPMPLRFWIARNGNLLSQMYRIFSAEVRRFVEGRIGEDSKSAARKAAGTISFIQRFGDGLRYNPHIHLLVSEGAWVESESKPGGLEFHPVRAPAPEEVCALKMSKSDDAETNALYLLDPTDVLVRKIKRAVTDLGNEVRFDIPEKPGVSNLMSILAATTGESLDVIAERYNGQGYGKFKQAVADAVVACLEPVQMRYRDIRSDVDGLQRVLRDGAGRAAATADATLKKVHDVLGFIPE
jgi:hypothetical protein